MIQGRAEFYPYAAEIVAWSATDKILFFLGVAALFFSIGRASK